MINKRQKLFHGENVITNYSRQIKPNILKEKKRVLFTLDQVIVKLDKNLKHNESLKHDHLNDNSDVEIYKNITAKSLVPELKCKKKI